QVHSAEFLIFLLMMRDYLAIQSINVICEQIFSVTENIIIKIQNRLYLETAK
ncbi:hypothetical protein RhiirA1_305050, partial [Rhizophagus irregularis]